MQTSYLLLYYGAVKCFIMMFDPDWLINNMYNFVQGTTAKVVADRS